MVRIAVARPDVLSALEVLENPGVSVEKLLFTNPLGIKVLMTSVVGACQKTSCQLITDLPETWIRTSSFPRKQAS